MHIAALVAGIFLMSQADPATESLNYPALAERLVQQMALQPGEKVLLLSHPGEHAPWIPYYGYGAGVVRLSLGDNSELGGKVTGGYVRWNLFTDATVTAGGQVWVKDGKLTPP